LEEKEEKACGALIKNTHMEGFSMPGERNASSNMDVCGCNFHKT